MPTKVGTHDKPAKSAIVAYCALPAKREFARNMPRSIKRPCIYLLASGRNGVLYIGVTSDLHQRMAEHDQGLVEGFTKRYSVKTLVYYEFFATMPEAITREKRLKEWQRAWKVRLIKGTNPEWRNLYDPATGEIAFLPRDVEREQ